jgi:hypothetical protein
MDKYGKSEHVLENIFFGRNGVSKRCSDGTILEEKIKAQVSQYASTGMRRFVAEVFVKIFNGTSTELSGEIVDLYRSLGGPLIKARDVASRRRRN